MKENNKIKSILKLMPEHPGVTKEERIELYKIAVANSDISEALITTRLFLEEVKDMQNPLYRALQDTIIISYSRPFKRSEPFGELDSRYLDILDRDTKNFHNKIISLRDKVIAHSDWSDRKVQIVPIGNKPTSNSDPNKEVAIQISTKRLPISEFRQIEKLCMLVGGSLDRLMQNKIKNFYGDSSLLPEKPFDLIHE